MPKIPAHTADLAIGLPLGEIACPKPSEFLTFSFRPVLYVCLLYAPAGHDNCLPKYFVSAMPNSLRGKPEVRRFAYCPCLQPHDCLLPASWPFARFCSQVSLPA